MPATINLSTAAQMGGQSLLTPSEAAGALRVSEKTLERWRSVGIGPSTVRIGPRRLAYRVADLLAFAGTEQSAA